MRGGRAGFTLVEMVVALAVICVLAAVLYGAYLKKGQSGRSEFQELLDGDAPSGSGPQSIPGKALHKARSTACAEYVRQCKAAVDMEAQDLGHFPSAIPSDMAPYAKCPDSGQPFGYDPATGAVWCPYHQQ